jgi:hypothetical protein
MARPVTRDPEKVATIARVRELLKVYGPCETARRTGYSQPYVTMIKNGKRGAKVKAISVNALQLRRTNQPCRRCLKPCCVVTRNYTCVECTILELAKQGLVQIKEPNEE